MQKKKLLEIPPKEFKGKSKEEYIVEAQVIQIEEDKILELDVYWKNPKVSGGSGKHELLARHFLNEKKEEYATYLLKDISNYSYRYQKDKWSGMQYRTLLNNGDINVWYHTPTTSKTEETRKVIKEYFSLEDTRGVDSYIASVESHIKWEKDQSALERKHQRINDMMDTVPAITDTEEFEQWIDEVVFADKYIFSSAKKEAKGYLYICSHCGRRYYSKEKPKHNTSTQCRWCKSNGIVKTRVSEITEEKNVMIAQPFGETYILRHLKFRRYSYAEKNTTPIKGKSTISSMEKVRMIMYPEDTKIYYNNDWFGRNASNWSDKKNGTIIDRLFYMYPEELDKTCMEENLKRTLMAAAKCGKYLQLNELIRWYESYAYIEYLIKGRFYELANRFLGGYRKFYISPSECLNKKGNSLSELLQIDKQKCNRLRDMDGNEFALNMLQIEERDGLKVTQENLQFINDNCIEVDDLQIYRTGLSVNRAINYIRKIIKSSRLGVRTVLQYYSDYLDMAKERGADLTDDIIRVYPRMIERHNLYVEERERKLNDNLIAEKNKKFARIEADYSLNYSLFHWEDKKYVITVPKNAGEIVMEGKMQHHCVASSDNYMQKMNDRKTFILFLRKKEAPDMPYYTLEVGKDNKIIQSYGAYDRKPDWSEVSKILTKWKKDIKQKQNKLERKAS